MFGRKKNWLRGTSRNEPDYVIWDGFTVHVEEAERLREESLKQAQREEFMRYGFKWWEKEDICEKAYYQTKCSTLLIPFEDYQKGLKKLLGRTVKADVLFHPTQEFFDEVEQAYKEWMVSKK